ncbi:hypothetical protein L1987_14620 [Smallanthus sonchifolius]|uniref:Uncharacterized protein n=1 Tax=Smallanthus sonchifolius TaxID=185202 RepID=A0ACB9J4C0_9ASTR|nr:hypothetical protein L1987_14620 [Smallanthus sonchifolius]
MSSLFEILSGAAGLRPSVISSLLLDHFGRLLYSPIIYGMCLKCLLMLRPHSIRMQSDRWQDFFFMDARFILAFFFNFLLS